MKLVNYLVGVFVVLAVIVGTIVLAGNLLLAYVDILSGIIVLLLPLPPMIGLFGWKGFWWSMMLAFRKEAHEKEEYRRAADVMRAWSRLIYISSFLGLLIAFIGILSYPEAADTANQYALHFGVALITLFYGLILNLVIVEPIRAYLTARS